jgi:hypothetical protein
MKIWNYGGISVYALGNSVDTLAKSKSLKPF